MNASSCGPTPARPAPLPNLAGGSMLCHPDCLEFDCECGKTLHIRRVSDAGKWYAQHGENPEHRSRFFDSRDLFLTGTREWRERIHARR